MARVQPLSSSKANSEQKLQETVPLNDAQKNALAETPRKTFKSRSKVLSFFTSIKFILVLIIFLLIFSCTVVFDSIWITAFSQEVGILSGKVRQSEFDNIISYTETSMKNVILATESTKSQLYSDFDFTNQSLIMDRTFRLQKIIKPRMDILHMLAIGDTNGNINGIEIEDHTVMFTTINQGKNQSYWTCNNAENSETCSHQFIPERVVNSSDYSFIAEVASTNPGKTIFTPSFVDSTSLHINMACSSSLSSSTKSSNNFVTIVMNLGVLSEFLYKQTTNITGSVVFVFDTISKDMIASGGQQDVFVDNVGRKTISTIGGGITKIGKKVDALFDGDFQKINCNTNVSFEIDDSYVAVRRMCVEEGVDWIFVYSVPQWTYIGNMIFAIICAIAGSVGVVIFGLTMATVFSIMVVKPFQNLIDSFELVSNMELDNFHLSRTLLSEVKSLQVHFIGMVERIRLYRKFIPSHLLSKLDRSEEADIGKKAEPETPLQEKHKDSSFSNPNSNSHSGVNSRKLLKQPTTLNMFSLYLEKKRVTAVSAFLDGINNLFNNANPKDCLSILADIFDVINHVAKISNGQVGKFENETVTIQFNASSEQPKHEMKGLQCCHSLLKKLKNLQETKLSKHIIYENNPTLNLDFHIVATTQECMCGNVGTREIMNFGVFGSVQSNTQTMIETAKELEIPIVISQELFLKIENKFQVRFVDFKNFVLDEYYSYPSVADRSLINTPRKVYELGESVNVEADEWMYELSAKEKNEHWKLYNEATDEYFNENFNNAIQLITKYLQNNAVDRVALHLKKNCEKRVSFESY